MATDTKQRMIEATITSLRRKGLSGTSFTEVLTASGAARGAIYHHFPGGKDELAQAAVRVNGEQLAGAIAETLEGTTVAEVVEAYLALILNGAADAAAGCGCAIAGVTTEAPEGSALQVAADDAFDQWRTVLQEQLTSAGATPAEARDLAALLVATLEGSLVLCRAAGSLEPFERAAAALRGLLRDAA